ncbi:MAG: PQQ-binding-like beta-propeller repeat protein [Verrucomicrobiota bacterium]
MKSFLAFLALACVLPAAFANEDWPQFRGPQGNGHSDSKGLPLQFGDANGELKNVKWKTPIHDRGWSSPVILGNQVWMTTATEDGKQLFAICVDRDTGKILLDQKLFDVPNPQFAHKFNSYASPSPVIEPGRVYITFGSPGTACLDTKTFKVLWQRTDIECNHFRGAGSSPIIHGNLLIMHYDGSDHQFVLALDKNTGKDVWRAKRSIDFQDLMPDGKVQAEGDFRKAYATPHIAIINGKPMLLSIGAKAAYAYEPKTGKEIWRVEERGQHSASTRPVVVDGLVVYPTGFSKGQLMAVKPDGTGNVTDSHVVWRVKRNVSNKPSVTVINGLIYMIDDAGIASCVDPKNGDYIWNERLVTGGFSASPVYVDGHLWFFSEEGKVFALKPGREFKVASSTQVGDGFMSSPAVAGKAFYLRTRTHLYRVEESGRASAK